ncbi:MAG: helix-turn-helix transcriptional regulator [Lachnospiraceae bacterium]|nr:helix-turn-helix transcriptional regulator [Lachnospiraceae bacterium]
MRKNLKEARQKAGMTQQQMADKLGLTLGHYQKIEYNKLNGSFEVWDALEDILGIHQRKLREIPGNHHDSKENQQEHLKNLQ